MKKLVVLALFLSALGAHASSALIVAEYTNAPGAGFLRLIATVGTVSRSSLFPMAAGPLNFTNLMTNLIAGASNRITGITVQGDVSSDESPPLWIYVPNSPGIVRTQPINLSAIMLPVGGGRAQMSRDLDTWSESVSAFDTGAGIELTMLRHPTEGAYFLRATPEPIEPPIPPHSSHTNSPSSSTLEK